MKLYKVKGIVLKSREMREADRMLTLYTLERGKLRAVAHGVNKPSSRKRGSVQPFCLTDFLLHRGRELDSVSQCQGLEMFAPLREDLSRLTYASYLAELVDSLTAEEEANRGVFHLLLTCFSLLARLPADSELVARSFEIRLAGLLGYEPRLDACVHCQGAVAGQVAFSSKAGGIICQSCRDVWADGIHLDRGALEILRKLQVWDPAKAVRIRPGPDMGHRLRQVLQGYLQYYLERKSRSLRFLEVIGPFYSPEGK
ncbi:MAG: DNA repair protein RecO [Bacillota bacterium]